MAPSHVRMQTETTRGPRFAAGRKQNRTPGMDEEDDEVVGQMRTQGTQRKVPLRSERSRPIAPGRPGPETRRAPHASMQSRQF